MRQEAPEARRRPGPRSRSPEHRLTACLRSTPSTDVPATSPATDIPRHTRCPSRPACAQPRRCHPPTDFWGCRPAGPGRERPHLQRLLPPLPRHEADQAAEPRGGRAHAALDLHQVLPGGDWTATAAPPPRAPRGGARGGGCGAGPQEHGAWGDAGPPGAELRDARSPAH